MTTTRTTPGAQIETCTMTPDVPVLCCPACGVVGVPRLEPGTGPYAAKAVCSACDRFIKWLPKVTMKEPPMVASVNRVVLLGTIGKYGVEVRYATSGTPCASFTLVVCEQGQDGKDHPALIPCEVWGKKAEAAGELDAEQLVLFEGKLKKRQKGDQWELLVSGFELTPITAGVPALTGRP